MAKSYAQAINRGKSAARRMAIIKWQKAGAESRKRKSRKWKAYQDKHGGIHPEEYRILRGGAKKRTSRRMPNN